VLNFATEDCRGGLPPYRLPSGVEHFGIGRPLQRNTDAVIGRAPEAGVGQPPPNQAVGRRSTRRMKAESPNGGLVAAVKSLEAELNKRSSPQRAGSAR